MRKSGTFLLVATLAGAVVMAAPARTSGNVVTLQVNQSLRLAGSHVLCVYQSRSGGSGIECAVVDTSGQPKHGSYVVVLPTNPPTGISVVIAYSNKVVFVRRAGSLMRVSTVSVRPGDQIKLAGSSNVG